MKIPLTEVANIKKEYELNPEETRKLYPNIFYYFDGLVNCVISQGFHPAGMIASPVNLVDNYGTFYDRTGKRILCVNMEECHEVNLVKYDILGLVNVQIIDETCKLANVDYPLSHNIDWTDQNVWNDMLISNIGIFQAESNFFYQAMKTFKPTKVDDMALLSAAMRPSGASYRDQLLQKTPNKNPSEQIDKILEDSYGFLVFQEQIIKFLQEVCGLSGSESDNIRRAIGRKQVDRLEKALPRILEGYCSKSDKPREVAEIEAKTFLKIIEDASSYMFGYNHSIAYSMISYLCAYYRYYYPLEFICSYLNNASKPEDIGKGHELAAIKGIKIKLPKFGKSSDRYYIDKNENVIYKGLNSIKGFSTNSSKILIEKGKNHYDSFYDLLNDLFSIKNSVNKTEIEQLIMIGYFDEFGSRIGLLKFFSVFKQVYGKKEFFKSRLPLSEELMKQFCEKESEKKLRGFNEKALCDYVISLTKNIPDSPMMMLQYEREILEEPFSSFENFSDDYYYVISIDIKRNVMVQLYKINNGEKISVKIRGRVYEENPFNIGEIINVKEIKEEPRYIYLGEDKNGHPSYDRDYSNMELILKKYTPVVFKP